jgi:cytidine deaminase
MNAVILSEGRRGDRSRRICSSGRLPPHSLRLTGDAIFLTTHIDPALASLLEQARVAAQHSYSPYSGFRVGAALLLTTGQVVTGTNVENVSYGLTMCAERSALVRAVSEFGPGVRIGAVAVANLNGAASPPCGACRQMLAEFILLEAPVIFPAADEIRVKQFSDLFPLAFEMKLK